MPTHATNGRNTAHIHRLQADLWDALISAAAADPGLTVEDELAALLGVAHRLADQLRVGQRTPALPDGQDTGTPSPAALAAWADVYKEAAREASRCPVCGSNQACRCYVPEEHRPDPVPSALAAVFPHIAQYVRRGQH